jgi:phosphoesterase RecJ-like protein
MSLKALADKIAEAEHVLLTCHRGPDGDSVGSLCALASLLKAQEKKFRLFNPDLVPRNLKWLPHGRSFAQQLKKNARFDLTVIVDCGDEKLLGDKFPAKEVTGEVVVLDHHGSGRPFGDLFVVEPDAAAVGVLVARIADYLGWTIDRDAAIGIYVALVTDTGGFRYANTNAEALKLAARLVEECGVSPWSISERMSERSSLARYRLMARSLDSIEVRLGGKVAFMTITAEMVSECKAAWEDTDGFVNFTRSIRGVECGVLITPSKYGGMRVSLRSKGKMIDAGEVCLALGGGGHRGAAGCTLQGTLEEARQTVEKALEKALQPAESAGQG